MRTEYVNNAHGLVLQVHPLGDIGTLNFPIFRGSLFPCKDWGVMLRLSALRMVAC